MKGTGFFIFLVFAVTNGFPQSVFVWRDVQQAYDKQTRSSDGNPGKNYWQNRGDYNIDVSFDPKTLLVQGKETITYFNNSPDALNRIIIHLFPDYYKHNVERNSDVDEKDENDGVAIESLMINDENYTKDSVSLHHKQTNLIVNLKNQIASGSQTKFQIEWHYRLNSGSQNRTGEIDSSSSFIAYFFPRISVYDDVDGWDDWSYSGIQEFYNDFGNFNVNITVPKGFVVWATGELKNESDVLSQKILDKLNTAKQSSQIIHVIDSSDYKTGLVTTANDHNTWKFEATNVTDFAFAVSNHYLWDACAVEADHKTKRKVLVETAFNKNDKDYFDVIGIAKRSVQIMCDTFPAYPFPFPHISVIDGTDQMEYPMMVNDNPTSSWAEAVQLTSHEIIHAYFPFFMGINETQYAWMDEGWATIGESVISPFLHAPEDDGVYRRIKYEEIAGTKDEVPMITNSKLITGETYYCNSYGKPGLCYWFLRDMLGEEKFFKSLHAYMDRWNGKHPTPYDFFNTFNNVSGENLDWFWDEWFFSHDYPDLSIKDVKVEKGKLKIIVENKGGLPLPVTLDVRLTNGETIEQHETAEQWKDGGSFLLFQSNVNSDVQSVTLGDEYTPDVNRKDNEWTK